MLREGDASDEIVREAKHTPTDLIVMGRHSQGTVNPWLWGSVAERVLRQAPCPVVVLRPVPRPGGESPRHVLCALDLGDTAAATLEYAAGIADAMGADLSVIHVVTEGPVEAARRTLDASASRVPAPKAGLRTQVVAGVPFPEILAAAHENGACRAVVGSHGGGIVDRPFLGSTTLHLLRQSECPCPGGSRRGVPAGQEDAGDGRGARLRSAAVGIRAPRLERAAASVRVVRERSEAEAIRESGAHRGVELHVVEPVPVPLVDRPRALDVDADVGPGSW